MPPFRADTANFNRFLASLGLLSIGAALAIPYFYFRNADVLEISSERLDGMTPTGREALLSRQDSIAALEPWVVGVAILLAMVGLIVLVIGTVLLKQSQSADDEESELRREHARAEIRALTPEEREEKLEEQAQETQALEPDPIPEPSTAQPPRDDDRARQPLPRVDLASWRRTISAIEGRVDRALNERAYPDFEFHSQLEVSSRTERIQLDGLFESREPGLPDIVLELKTFRTSQAALRGGRNAADQLIAIVSRYRRLRRRKAGGWLLIVVAEGESPSVQASQLQRINELIGSFGRASVLTESEIREIPDMFIDTFTRDVLDEITSG